MDHDLTRPDFRAALVQAWIAGWQARGTTIGQPIDGRYMAQQTALLNRFLQAWGVPALPADQDVPAFAAFLNRYP